MEGMDADCYVVEYPIRDRLLDARATARTAALLLQANDLPRSKGIETRRVGFGRALVGWARGVGAAISHAVPPPGATREAPAGAATGKEGLMTYSAKPLSCDPTKLRGLSEKLIRSHWENNYGGAVRRLNAIAAQLAELDFAKAPIFVINGLKREELIATNSMILHELYFEGLGGDGISGGAIDEALTRDFGSVDRWRAEFVGMGKALRGGSGWVLLTYSHRDRRLVNQWAADHTHALAGGAPILALDMYEHSYQLDYGASAEGYVDAFMENINWTNVARLLEAHVPGERESEFEVWRTIR